MFYDAWVTGVECGAVAILIIALWWVPQWLSATTAKRKLDKLGELAAQLQRYGDKWGLSPESSQLVEDVRKLINAFATLECLSDRRTLGLRGFLYMPKRQAAIYLTDRLKKCTEWKNINLVRTSL